MKSKNQKSKIKITYKNPKFNLALIESEFFFKKFCILASLRGPLRVCHFDICILTPLEILLRQRAKLIFLMGLIFAFALLLGVPSLYAQEIEQAPLLEAEVEQVEEEILPAEELEPASLEEEKEEKAEESKEGNVTLDFKDADIRNVLRILSYKSGVNIVASPEVSGVVTIRLADVPWEIALDVILKTYGFGYEREENIIVVYPIEKLTERKKAEFELAEVQPVVTEIFHLRYLDAQDAKQALETQLSPRGKITVVEMTGPAGWEFGGEAAKRTRETGARKALSKILIISDVPPSLERLRKVVASIDIRPQQVLIEARIVEVNKDKLKDIGFDWGIGVDGLPSLLSTRQKVTTYYETVDDEGYATKSTYEDLVTMPEIPLDDKGTLVAGGQVLPDKDIGLEFFFQKLTGTQFEVFFKALVEKTDANILSAPKILTLNNQEAGILVGEKYPILKSEVSGETAVVTKTLDYYQDLGVQLNVVPQICSDDYINMIIHPAVLEYKTAIENYPRIDTREADTQILIKDGETIVIGGLLKDKKTKIRTGIPILMDIPLLGLFFQRYYNKTEKIELMIFITAHIIKGSEKVSEEVQGGGAS